MGDHDGPGLIGKAAVVKRDSRGRFYIADHRDPGVIKVFGPNGQFLRELGRRGRGPGEYELVHGILVGPGDTLHVFDPAVGRRTVLSPSYDVVRTHLLHVNVFPKGYVLLDDGGLLLNGIRNTPSSFGFPLHRLDSTGKFLRSFGTDDTYATWRTVYRKTWRAVAPAGNDRVWVSHREKYVLELWDSQGSKRRQLVREAPWFGPPGDEPHTITPDVPPRATITAMQMSDNGLLWVFVWVGDPEWYSALERRQGPDGEYWAPREYDRVYDTVIEVIDPARGSLVATERVDQLISGIVDQGHVWSVRGEVDDIQECVVWSVKLKRGP